MIGPMTASGRAYGGRGGGYRRRACVCLAVSRDPKLETGVAERDFIAVP
jgi:hypothetical protein